MKTSARVTGAAGLALALIGLGAAGAVAAPGDGASARGGAVFVQTDNTSGNTVVAYRRSPAGALTQTGVYPTGGLGGVLTGSVVDHLASQGSLEQDDGLLYAVNAGSDTITTFSIDGDRLSRRQVIDSGGDFPVSVTAHGDLVYVLNARSGGSVQGFRRIGNQLVKVPAWSRALGLDPAATPEFTHTPGQIGFTPDGDQLVITTKASTNAVDVFAVGRSGALSASPVVNVDPAGVPFGFTFDAQGRLVLSETGSNAIGIFTISGRGITTLAGRKATGQAATCWVIRIGSSLYASNAGSGSLSGFGVDRSGGLTVRGTTATDAGTVDAAASIGGRFLYVQTGAAGNVNEFSVASDGSLTRIGSVTVPGAAGGQGITAS